MGHSSSKLSKSNKKANSSSLSMRKTFCSLCGKKEPDKRDKERIQGPIEGDHQNRDSQRALIVDQKSVQSQRSQNQTSHAATPTLSVEKPLTIKSAATPTPSSHQSPPPLLNKGEICYMNSIIQAVGSCKNLREDLKILGKEYHSTKLIQFTKLLDALNSHSAQREFDTFMDSYGWKKEGQQDSYEMFAFFMNQIYNEVREESLKASKMDKGEFITYWKKQILPGRINLYSKTKCECKSDNRNIYNDLAFRLPLVNREGTDSITYDVNYIIKEYLREDDVSEKCDKCNQSQKLMIALEGEPPRTLCLHIQANKYDFQTDVMMKPDYRLRYPFNLLIQNRKFELVSLVEHMGGVSVGHYVAYRKLGSNWFKTNDSFVTLLPTVKDPYEYCQKPYVLFYEITRLSSDCEGQT